MKIAAIALLAAVALTSACSTVRAEKDGKSWTCIPNDARDRGPFVSTPTPGVRLTVAGEQGGDARVADAKPVADGKQVADAKPAGEAAK